MVSQQGQQQFANAVRAATKAECMQVCLVLGFYIGASENRFGITLLQEQARLDYGFTWFAPMNKNLQTALNNNLTLAKTAADFRTIVDYYRQLMVNIIQKEELAQLKASNLKGKL
jgi:hypothetical protein